MSHLFIESTKMKPLARPHVSRPGSLMSFRNAFLASAMLGAALSACAQDAKVSTMAAEFPPEAEPIVAQALKSHLAGRVFKARLYDHTGWRLQFKGDFIFVNISSGASDSGRWRTEDGRLCVDYQRFPSGCSDIRASDSRIYLKRASTGEVVTLIPDD